MDASSLPVSVCALKFVTLTLIRLPEHFFQVLRDSNSLLKGYATYVLFVLTDGAFLLYKKEMKGLTRLV